MEGPLISWFNKSGMSVLLFVYIGYYEYKVRYYKDYPNMVIKVLCGWHNIDEYEELIECAYAGLIPEVRIQMYGTELSYKDICYLHDNSDFYRHRRMNKWFDILKTNINRELNHKGRVEHLDLGMIAIKWHDKTEFYQLRVEDFIGDSLIKRVREFEYEQSGNISKQGE